MSQESNNHSQPDLASADCPAPAIFPKDQKSFSYNKNFRLTSRRECLVQVVGNWRLVKFRKTFDTFECIECSSLLIITKHPSYCDCKLIHSSQVKKDHTFVEADVEFEHAPYD